MDLKEIRNMRLKQVAVTNGLVVGAIILFFLVISVFEIKFTHLYFALGVLVFLQVVIGFLRGDSTASIIPIFEKVALYEKQKMGKEWYKQKKSSRIAGLILSALLFLQAYMYRNFEELTFEIDVVLMSMLAFLVLIIANFIFLIHFRKVDRSTSELDMKGYTWKSHLLGVVLGLVLGIAAFTMIVIYAISKVFLS